MYIHMHKIIISVIANYVKHCINIPICSWSFVYRHYVQAFINYKISHCYCFLRPTYVYIYCVVNFILWACVFSIINCTYHTSNWRILVMCMAYTVYTYRIRSWCIKIFYILDYNDLDVNGIWWFGLSYWSGSECCCIGQHNGCFCVHFHAGTFIH